MGAGIVPRPVVVVHELVLLGCVVVLLVSAAWHVGRDDDHAAPDDGGGRWMAGAAAGLCCLGVAGEVGGVTAVSELVVLAAAPVTLLATAQTARAVSGVSA